MKKFISIFLSALMLCGILSTSAGAAVSTETNIPDLDSISKECVDVAELISEGKSDQIPEYIDVLDVKTFNEYDMALNLKSQNKNTLQTAGYTTKMIDEMANGGIERELMARAQMKDEELYAMGYTPNEISILRDYDGSPIEDNPQLRAATATLTGSISKISASDSTASAMFNFSWSKKPLVILAQVSDMLSCGWSGTNQGNEECQMIYSSSSCVIKYSDGSMRSYTPAIKNSLKWIQAKVLQSTVPAADGNYIKSGTFAVYLKEHVTVHKLSKTEFGFSYGHSTIVANGGVTILPNVKPTFSFGIGVSNAYSGWKTVTK